MSPRALACGDEPCIIDAPAAPVGSSNQERAADIDRRARVVDDLEQVEHREVVVLVLDDDARLGSDLDDARPRRFLRRGFGCGLLLRGLRRRCRQSARRGRRPAPGTGNSCDVSVSPSTVVVACTSAPARQAVELRAALRVGLAGARVAADLERHRLPGDVVAHPLAHDAHGDGADPAAPAPAAACRRSRDGSGMFDLRARGAREQ